jgi:ABC-2 type transport system ATP-binding protein
MKVHEVLRLFADLYGIDDIDARIRDRPRSVRHPASCGSKNEELVRAAHARRIVKSVLHHPALLVLDEPPRRSTDVALRVRWLREISEDEGTALLVTSHDMVEVERLCDRACSSRGTVVADGLVDEITAATGTSPRGHVHPPRIGASSHGPRR